MKSSRTSALEKIVLVILLAVLSIILAHSFFPAELQKVVWNAAVGVIAVGVVGGFLKLVYDEIAAAARVRTDAATFFGNVLADLKSVYDRVERARQLIRAHRSVKTYGEEMRDIIEARVKLKNVVRALENRPGDGDAISGIGKNIEKMENFLTDLTLEFEDNYKEFSVSQRYYEARAANLAKAFGEGGDPAPLKNEPWNKLQSLPKLMTFLEKGDAYERDFVDQLDNATRLLRDKMARLSGQ